MSNIGRAQACDWKTSRVACVLSATPCKLMVKLVGSLAVCERMKENSAAGTQRVTLLSSNTLFVFLQTDSRSANTAEQRHVGYAEYTSTS